MNFVLTILVAYVYIVYIVQTEEIISTWKQLENAVRTREENVKKMEEILSSPQMLDRYLYKYLFKTMINLELNQPMLDFRWENCDPSPDPIVVKKFSIMPDPISVPGKISLNFDIEVKDNLVAPIKLDAELKKKFGNSWIPVKHYANTDVCKLIRKHCPEFIVKTGLPCKCPIPAGHYRLDKAVVHVPDVKKPAFLVDGDFAATVVVSIKEKRLLCLKVFFSLEKQI